MKIHLNEFKLIFWTHHILSNHLIKLYFSFYICMQTGKWLFAMRKKLDFEWLKVFLKKYQWNEIKSMVSM